MNRTFLWLLMAALSLLTSVAIHAAPPAGGVGVIDLTQVYKGYIGVEAANAVMGSFQMKAAEPAKILIQGIGLEKEDLEQYTKLMGKEVKDQDSIKKLEEKSQANSKKYNDLKSKMKAALSDEEQKRFDDSLQEIVDILSQGQISDADTAPLKEAETAFAAVETKGKSYLTADEQKDYDLLHPVIKANLIAFTSAQINLSQEMQKKGKIIQDKFTAELDKAIDKVARNLKLAAIVSKNIQSSQSSEKIVLWYDPNADVTDKVVKELNENFKLKPDMFK